MSISYTSFCVAVCIDSCWIMPPFVASTPHLEASVRRTGTPKVVLSTLTCPSVTRHTCSPIYPMVSLLSDSLGTPRAQLENEREGTKQGSASENFLGVWGGRLKFIFVTGA